MCRIYQSLWIVLNIVTISSRDFCLELLTKDRVLVSTVGLPRTLAGGGSQGHTPAFVDKDPGSAFQYYTSSTLSAPEP